MARRLYTEYTDKRKLLLRIHPNDLDNNPYEIQSIFQIAGFKLTPFPKDSVDITTRTILVDLSKPLDQLRQGLKPRWRTELNRAQRNKLEIRQGTDDNIVSDLVQLYHQMRSIKGFVDFANISDYVKIQKDLPPELKMMVTLCEHKNKPISGALTSPTGQAARAIFWATNEKGRELRASYLLQWKILEWLKNQNIMTYDLGGINPEVNPGPYRFKAGLSGKNGTDVNCIGQFDVCLNPLSLITAKVVHGCRNQYRKLKVRLKN
jgi:lipid II:glycine glycyltransferase (peptidoglycan interpeptide bridge formation enzyme)